MNPLRSLSNSRRSEGKLLAMLGQSDLSLMELEATISALNDAFRRFLERDGASGEKLRCSFCHRSQSEVKRLIAGTKAAICDECAAIAVDTAQLPKDVPASPH